LFVSLKFGREFDAVTADRHTLPVPTFKVNGQRSTSKRTVKDISSKRN